MSEHQIYSHTEKAEPVKKLYGHQTYTGFPNQANDTIRPDLDFNAYLVPNKTATFTMRVEGTGLIEANIHPGDMIIVDRSKTPGSGSLIVAVLNNEFTLKILQKRNNQISLHSSSKQKPKNISPEDDFFIWGVVTFVIHDVRARCGS